jgi:hypothetical protein
VRICEEQFKYAKNSTDKGAQTMFRRIIFSALGLAGFVGLGFSATMAARADKPTPPKAIQIRMRDFCDQKTFDAATQPGTCLPIIGKGVPGMPFNFFLGVLAEDKSVGEWRFSPDAIQAEEGTKLVLVNRGGETHTLTRVEKFGGGFIAPLNALSGNPIPVSECAQVLPDGTLIPQPESPDNIFVEALTTEQGPTIKEGDGPIKFECCVHPGMRLVVNHKGHEDHH